mmetsp:Transcript_2052/g.3630  ORF Transcript_2052/g.3630 Transcript_2052/m.3630 type:complete len:104 (+) Transcript_2052:21-332(+)
MGRTKKKTLLKPFCFYCDKEFLSQAILLKHQKNRHFGCKDCKKKFSSANGLSTHALQRHRTTVLKVHNAKKGRDSTQIAIKGMAGGPQEVIEDRILLKTVQKM